MKRWPDATETIINIRVLSNLDSDIIFIENALMQIYITTTKQEKS